MEGKQAFSTIDEYIKGFPTDIQAILESVRKTIKEAAPGAREIIGVRTGMVCGLQGSYRVLPNEFRGGSVQRQARDLQDLTRDDSVPVG